MGIPVQAVETMKDLRAAIKFFADRDVILIDTTGRNHCEVSQNWELAEFMADSPEMRKAIVASARTPASDLSGIVDSYGMFKPNCVIFTKLDETEEHGSIVSELVRSKLPLAYVTTGQSVLKDILKPDLRPLIDLALGTKRTRAWDALAQPVRSRLAPKRKEANRSTKKPADDFRTLH
jgi:flagellar biosynthesis protein FlhF